MADKNKKVSTSDKNQETKRIVKIILNVVFWVAIVGLMIVWLTDFIMTKNSKEPIFCISNKTHVFDDGTVEECTGLGYKIYNYDRSSMSDAVQFSPFFVKMKNK